MRVVIGDLTHRAITLSIDTFPFSAGLLAAYSSKYCQFRLETEIHRFYESFLESVSAKKPDIVALSNYSWNCNLSRHTARMVRALYPEILLVAGGPNMPSDQVSQDLFFQEMAPFDVCVIGEGEQVFLDLIHQYEQASRSRQRFLQNQEVPSVIMRTPDGQLRRSQKPKVERIKELDLIPSPYLGGYMDAFFQQGLYPIMQTNRGCPFTCTFCLEGTDYYSKVNKFSMERILLELEYIAKRCKSSDVLFIADSNFGMYRRDIDIAAFLAQLQARYNWPRFINCTTGKNSPGTVIQAVDLLNGALEISNSVQSLNAETLKNIRRENIHLSAYSEMQTAIRSRGLRSLADLILCLPGESIQSHFEGIRQLLDSGIQRILPYQLMLLNGTQLNTPESRFKYEFMTRYRIVARNFGKYSDQPVYEWEEIVVATNTLSFEDYLQCRLLHLLLEIYLKQEPFRELFLLLEKFGVKRSDLIFALYEKREQMPAELRQLCEAFLKATGDELFATQKELVEFLSERYESLAQELIGANLLQKYSVIGWFHSLHAVLEYLADTSIFLLTSRVEPQKLAVLSTQIKEIVLYLEAIYVNLLADEDLYAVHTVALSYDVGGWVADGCKADLAEYRLTVSDAHSGVSPCTRDFVFELSEDKRALLEDKLKTFGKSKSGLGKMLTRLYLQDIRRNIRMV